MSGKSESSNVNRRHFLLAAGSVVATRSFAAGKDVSSALAPPPLPMAADYLVTIDITHPKVTYSTPAQNDASVLKKVKPNETFTWAVKTPSNGQYRVTILFLKTTPFDDGHGHKIFAFQGDAAHGGAGGTIAASVTNATYKYYVAVFDDDTGLTTTDDPKIIVGDGDSAEAEVALALDDLKDAYASLSSKPKVQRQIESVEHKLEHVIDEVKK
jgi:hypothetical protein